MEDIFDYDDDIINDIASTGDDSIDDSTGNGSIGDSIDDSIDDSTYIDDTFSSMFDSNGMQLMQFETDESSIGCFEFDIWTN